MSFLSPWSVVGTNLDLLYPKEYFFWQKFENSNFMKLLTPPDQYFNQHSELVDASNFFATKVLNIFIAQKPYGWVDHGSGLVFDWADDATAYSLMIQGEVDRWLSIYDKFPYYKTLVYIDMYTADQILASSPTSNIVAMMSDVALRFEQFCTDTPGFEYRGVIDSQVDANFFQSDITEFFGEPRYKKPAP